MGSFSGSSRVGAEEDDRGLESADGAGDGCCASGDFAGAESEGEVGAWALAMTAVTKSTEQHAAARQPRFTITGLKWTASKAGLHLLASSKAGLHLLAS
ncbi:MAG TPA: hypothetical protein VGF82_06185 [Terracidiphilus sp.]